jgi:hypothetical protein
MDFKYLYFIDNLIQNNHASQRKKLIKTMNRFLFLKKQLNLSLIGTNNKQMLLCRIKCIKKILNY